MQNRPARPAESVSANGVGADLTAVRKGRTPARQIPGQSGADVFRRAAAATVPARTIRASTLGSTIS